MGEVVIIADDEKEVPGIDIIVQDKSTIVIDAMDGVAELAVTVAAPEASIIDIRISELVPSSANVIDETILTIQAGEVISGGKAVIIGTDKKAYVFNILNEAHYGHTTGIAKQGVLMNEWLEVKVRGVLTEVGSGWSAGKTYYVGLNGILNENPPSSGITKIIGVGLDTDKILLKNDSTELIII